MGLRVECNAEGFEDNWVELDMDRWSVRESNELDAADVNGLVELFRRKVIACRVELNTGEILTGPNDFTEDSILDADELVLGWLGGTFHTAIWRRRSLGNLSARPSLNSNEQTAPKVKA